MFKNEYVLKVDIKRKMTAIVPTFVQNDTAILVFKVYDNGKPFDLTNYTRAEVTHKRKDGQVVIGLASIERVGSEDIVKYQYMGNEMNKEGFVDTTLTLFSNKTRVSIQPFQISIVADIRDAIGAQEEFGILQDLIAEVTDTKRLIEAKISEIDKAIVDSNKVLADTTTAKEQAELATTNANNSALNANTKAELADQKATLADNAASNADEKALLAQQATDNAFAATTEALNAKDSTILAIENAEEATTEIQTLSSNMKHTGDYNNVKQYYKGNEARQNGSTFVAIKDTLGNPPPLPPLTSNTFWEMRAQRGVDGEGSVSSVNGLFPDPDGNVNLGNLSTSWNNLTEKPPVFPPSAHNHNISDVNGLQTALNNAGTKEVATQLKNGLMAKEDKTKLDGIETGANKYVHPTTHPATIIEQDSNNRMLSDVKIAEFEAKETVEGAQSKADTAESNAKTHADNKIGLLYHNLTQQLADTVKVFKPENYGAVGDGVTDDYQALQDMVADVNINAGGYVYFENGKNYYIGRYRVGGSSDNGVRNIVFSDCIGLVIHGYGAKITCKGDFHRGTDETVNGHNYSRKGTVMPLHLENCMNVLIEGLELDGQVNLTTKDANVVEADCHGIVLAGCENVHFNDVYAHHFGADGLMLYASSENDPKLGVRKVCRNITANNLRCKHNARQGVTVGHVVNASFINSEFSYTGVTEGDYGAHSPACGIDFEMDFPKEYVEETSKNIEFIGCKLIGNLRTMTIVGAGVGGTDEKLWGNISFINCVMKTEVESTVGIYFGGQMSVRDCLIDTPNANINFNGSVNSEEHVLLSNCDIRSSMFVLTENQTITVNIDGNKIDSHVYIQNAPLTNFRNNIVYLPKSKHNGESFTILTRLQNIQLSSGNDFKTDLSPVDNRHFAVVYDGTKKIVNDKYPSNRSFRPSYNSSWIGSYFNFDAAEVWKEAVLQNNWSGSIKYLKDTSGNVFLSGSIWGGALTQSSTVIFTLSPECVPSRQSIISASTMDAEGVASALILYIKTSGEVVFEPNAKQAIYIGGSFKI